MGLFFKNLSSALSEGGTNGQTLRVAIIAAPGGQPVPNQPNIDNTLLAPEQRGQPVVGAGQRPVRPRLRRVELPALQPVPVHRGAGAAEGLRGRATRRSSPGKLVIGNVPGQKPTTLHYDSKLTASRAAGA